MQLLSKQGRRASDAYRPHIFWLFGFSGAGKSTLAEALRADLLATCDVRPLMLDGDRLRDGLCRGLGFGDEDRAENLRRAAEVARLGVESGQAVIASFITPREAHRLMIAEIVGAEMISLIHVDATLEVCRARDVKGLYARSLAGGVPQMTGVSAGFDSPARYALKLDTSAEAPALSAARLTGFAREKLGLRVPRWEFQAEAV